MIDQLEVGTRYVTERRMVITIVGTIDAQPIDTYSHNGIYFTDLNGKYYTSNGQEVRLHTTSDDSPLDHIVDQFIGPTLISIGPDDCKNVFTQQMSGKASFDEWRLWGEQTFGPCTPMSIVQRAKQEMDKELIPAITDDNWTPEILEEIADIILILTRAPGLWETMEQKMKINKNRQWNLHGDGTGTHC